MEAGLGAELDAESGSKVECFEGSQKSVYPLRELGKSFGGGYFVADRAIGGESSGRIEIAEGGW